MKSNRKSARTTVKAIALGALFFGALTLVSIFLLVQAMDPCISLPLDCAACEKPTNLYRNPQPVIIEGYSDDCMEPFVTGDGNYLLFNNSNSPFVDTHIHLCKRVSKNHFQHLGFLAGSLSKSKDMAPTIDAHGKMFYTCLRSYQKDGHSIYCGNFAKEKLTNISLAPGQISGQKPAEINMDCDVSKDGNTLILSRAHFSNYLLPPDKSDLLLAEKENGEFRIDPAKQGLLSRVNTTTLEYAPCQSADRLELYFTRASKKPVDGARGKPEPYFRIMVARRQNISAPFDEPEKIETLDGFIEAPTVTDDKGELFFHKKVGDKFRIFCAERKTEK